MATTDNKEGRLRIAIEAQVEELEAHRVKPEEWAGRKLVTKGELMAAWVGSGMAAAFREGFEKSVSDEVNRWHAGVRVKRPPSEADAWSQYRDHGGHLCHHDQ